MHFSKNKTTLLPSFNMVCKILCNNCTECSCDFLYSNNFALMHKSDDNITHSIKIWRTNTMFNYWYNNYDSSDYNNFIASLDYQVDNDSIIINKFIVNDQDFAERNNSNRFLSDIKAKNLTKSLLKYIENYAKEEEINKIILYVYYTLKSYNKYYKSEGYKLTQRNCKNNYIEAEKIRDYNCMF